MALQGRKVLFAWELGEGLGHLPALKAIALGLKRDGVRPVFVVRDAKMALPTLVEVGGDLRTAPHWAKPKLARSPSGSYADLLQGNGYSSAAHAQVLIAAWDKLIDDVKPDLVVCEHAPSAALSAFGRLPVAFVGNGFVVPPANHDVFPPYVDGRGDARNQQPVFVAIQEALALMGRRAPSTLCEAFRGAFRGIYSFPELDTYRRLRQEPVLGPIETPPPLTPLPSKRQIYFYSAANLAMIETLMQCVMDVGPSSQAFFRGTLGVRAAVLRSRGVHVFDSPPSLASVLAPANVVFSHGGTGFTNAALASGRPHIVYPRHFEAHATAQALVEMGCGICLEPFDVSSFRLALARANEDRTMQDAAQQAGARAHAFVAKANALEVSLAALRMLLN